MSYVIKIGKPDKDVLDCTDEELYYSSDWNNWKIYKDSKVDGTESLTVPAFGSDYVDIFHSLGYVPAVEIWVNDGSYNVAIPGPDVNIDYNFDFYIDSSKVRVYGADGGLGADKTFTVYYKIYYEQIGQ